MCMLGGVHIRRPSPSSFQDLLMSHRRALNEVLHMGVISEKKGGTLSHMDEVSKGKKERAGLSATRLELRKAREGGTFSHIVRGTKDDRESVRERKWTAFIHGFSIKWPLKALYNIASQSPIRGHIHTPTAKSTTQGVSQLVGSSYGGVSCSRTSRHSMCDPRSRDRTSNVPVTSQPALPPEPHAALLFCYFLLLRCSSSLDCSLVIQRGRRANITWW